MCNRFRLAAKEAELARSFGADISPERGRLPPPELFPRYEAYVIRKSADRRLIDVKTWGIPRRMPGKSGKMITSWVTNVRNLQSPFWRSTLASPAWRCLVPFTRFAEPRPGKDGEGRPACWWFDLPGSEIAAFAGIWRPYSVPGPKGDTLAGEAFAFLTCEPNPLVAPLHPKAMPVILHPEDYDRWLEGDAADACSLAAPFPSQLMQVA